MHAHGRLRKIQPLSRARDVQLGQQNVERNEKVQVQLAEIIHGNTCHISNSFLIYRGDAYRVFFQT